MFALKAFQKIDPYAQALSNLVRVSKVDTKKFGNDLTLHLNFINSYNKFRYGENDVEWKLTNQKVERAGGVVYADKFWTREQVKSDISSLYVFTDNTDRDSGSQSIDDDSWYAQKYGTGHHYPKQTQAVIRGLDNAMPISTQRWYHKGAKY